MLLPDGGWLMFLPSIICQQESVGELLLKPSQNGRGWTLQSLVRGFEKVKLKLGSK